jgi:hypothetical protein
MDTKTQSKRPRKPFGFIHIGKTGGSALKEAILKDQELTGTRKVANLGHRCKLAELLENGPLGYEICFVVREPVSRFVSGFNSRFRGGRHGDAAWKPKEIPVFERFTTPNALAEALSSEDSETRDFAMTAMRSVSHLRRGLAHHFRNVKLLEEVKDQIFFIGHLPTLDEDYTMFRTLVGLRPDIELPKDDVGAHRAPDTVDKRLSAVGEANVRDYYAKDYPIYEWCLKRREELVADFRARHPADVA